MPRLEIVPLPTPARVAPGDDLTGLLLEAAAAAGVGFVDGDVVCVASKIVSKAEGATAAMPEAADVHAARRTLAAEQAARVVAETPWVLVVETRHGFVCANAGIDTSNVAGGEALLLPEDPDGAAAALRRALRERAGADVGVVVTDTFGRPWRMGQTDVALGSAGVEALRDERGSTDLEGRTLEVTMVAVADELAAAADLARRKADGTPFVLLRGADVAGDGTARDLLRDASEDVFRTGGPTTVEAAVFAPGPVPWHTDPDWDPSVTERAIVATAGPAFGEPDGEDPGAPPTAQVTDLSDAPPVGCGGAPVVIGFFTDGSANRLVWAGTAAERARLVLEAHGVQARWVAAGGDVPAIPLPPLGRLVGTTDGHEVDVDAGGVGLTLAGVVLGWDAD
ncbi:MAG: coenzyme F420-0:L-glutamate ligase [Actinobacteria bacterium]|nr:coenzyme F420-0:L-glutamate ligase [Actinomycetota bacterium]